MANPFSTLTPANQQPQAGTPSLQQAPSVIGAAQFPGAAQAPGFGSGQQLTLQNLGQSQQQGVAPGGQLAPLPQLAPYTALQPFYQALDQQPQLAVPQYGDPTLQAIQQKLRAAQASSLVLSEQAPPHPSSVLAKQQSAMSPLQILGAAGQTLWQQEVVKPVQDFIRTWQQDPKQGLAETALGVGAIAGIVGLETVTGGMATPVIFGAFAVMAAPSLVQSWSQEVMDPNDGHLVQALVSTGAGVITVGSPVRAFKGIQTARGLLNAAVSARKDITTADEAAGLLLGGKAAAGDLRTGVPLERQLEVLSLDPEIARSQLEARGASLEEGPAKAYAEAAQTQATLRERLRLARNAGDVDAAQGFLGEIRDHAKNVLAPSMMASAHEHLMIPSAPYAHVPLGPLEGVVPELHQALDEGEGAIRGLFREVHGGNALQGLHEATTKLPSILEQGALDTGAGTAHDMGNRVLTKVEDMARAAGLDGLNDSRVEDVLQALEEPKKWEALVANDPHVAAFGQRLRNISNMATTGELRFGTIALPLLGRVAHYIRGTAGDAEAEPVDMFSGWWRNPTGSKSRYWKTAVDDETGMVKYLPRTRGQIIAKFKQQTAFYEATHEHRQTYFANRDEINTLRRRFGQLEGKRGLASDDAKVAASARKKLDEMLMVAHGRMGKLAPELVGMELKQLKKIRRAAPATQELVTGGEAVRQMLARHMNRMHMAVIGEGLRSHADLNMERLQQVFQETPMKTWAASMALPSFRSQHELPDVLPETVFLGQSRNAGTVEANAQRLGYFLAHAAIGSPKDLHYRPALYAHGDLANKIKQAESSVSGAELQHSALDALYKLNNVSKRFVMYSPMFHLFNVAGRAFAFLLNDPAVAGSAFKAVHALQKDGESYYALLEEAGQAGLVHANKWNVSHHLQRLMREEDGQHHFLGAIRNFGRAIDDMHSEWAERGLWNTVDHIQLAGYLYAKTRFAEKGVDAVEARRLAAQYANTLGGMTNPLYMSRLWRHIKSQVFFAPSYWATFLHSMESVVPGASRLSNFMAQAGGGRFVRLSPVPLKAIDYRSRRELVRAQRSWMLTYLATSIMSMDLMNLMFSGHHLWDNEQGRMMDVDVTNVTGTSQGDAKHLEPKRAFITTMPFFRQGVDVANAIGLGHDYGFAHTLNDQNWRQQDALHKTEMALGGLADGIRREAANKTGNVPQAAYGLATGEEMTARLGQGMQRQIDRPEALLSLVPNGFQTIRLIKQYQQDAAAQSGQLPPAVSFLKDVGISVLSNSTGIPSAYHMGVETPPIDDSKYQNWQSQRTAIHDQLLAYSNAVFSGVMNPQEYSRHKHDAMIRTNQLNKDTWGDNSAGASLSAAYSQLSKQFGLDNQTLTDQQWFELYDVFLPAWEQMLQSAAPSTRAAWWEHSTQQWTDADYLEWEARQLKQQLAASVDGQGGAYIRAYQNQLYQLKPTLTAAEFMALEEQDPYYSAYKTLLSNIGMTSPLGAFVGAFSSPFSRTQVLPPGFAPEDAEALAQHTGGTVVRSEEAQQLAQQARQVAKDPNVAAAGGQATASPDFQQQLQAAEAQA
jgi:hypothetical protein